MELAQTFLSQWEAVSRAQEKTSWPSEDHAYQELAGSRQTLARKSFFGALPKLNTKKLRDKRD